MRIRIQMSGQRKVTVGILVIGAALLTTEFLLIRWYPGHQEREQQQALKLLPYQNSAMGLQIDVAAAIYGKVRDSGKEVTISRWKLFGNGPSIAISLKPNSSAQFTPELLAQLETAGVRNNLLGYQFQHMTLGTRDAILIWQYDEHSRSMNVTAHVLAPDRMIQAVCNTGSGDQDLYTEACNETLKSIQLSGPPSNLPETDTASN
ncbi:MAG TPA: hypothetical protein VMI06_08760 [Terriglobia bacterium]|nr:hypothetical protein [Terriglobia bacterium]